MNPAKRRVLLVDDDPSIIKMIGKRLEVSGYEVLTAMDGEDGLAKAQTCGPHVVILDLMMPKLSGVEVCAALRKDPRFRQIPIVVIFTGKGGPGDEQLCREVGANAYISKSSQGKAMIDQIEALLDKCLPEQPQRPAESTS